MRLRTYLVVFACIALGVGGVMVVRKSSPPPKVVAVLNHAAVAEPSLAGFKQGMAALGWRDGESITYLYGGPEPSAALLRAQAKDYVDGGVDLVVALSTPAAQAAAEVTEPAGVPLLMAPASDPVGSGLVQSTSHPGRPITGIAFALQEPRRLEWLARLVPGTRVVWVPYDFTDPSPKLTVHRIQGVADKLGLKLVVADIRSLNELHSALADIPAEVEAIFIPPDARMASAIPAVLAAAAARRLPVTTPHREGVAQGALFSYGFDLTALGRQAARLADQILKGIPASDLPIETAEMGLTINVASAAQLGIAIPDDILRQAIIQDRPMTQDEGGR